MFSTNHCAPGLLKNRCLFVKTGRVGLVCFQFFKPPVMRTERLQKWNSHSEKRNSGKLLIRGATGQFFTVVVHLWSLSCWFHYSDCTSQTLVRSIKDVGNVEEKGLGGGWKKREGEERFELQPARHLLHCYDCRLGTNVQMHRSVGSGGCWWALLGMLIRSFSLSRHTFRKILGSGALWQCV